MRGWRRWGRTGRVTLVPSPEPGASQVDRVYLDGAVLLAAIAPATPANRCPCPAGEWQVCTRNLHKRCCPSLDAAVVFALRVEEPNLWREEALVEALP